MCRMCAKRHKHVFIEDISWETKRSSFSVSEEQKGTVEIKRTHSFHFISLSFSFSFPLSLSLALSPSLDLSLYTCIHMHRDTLSHRGVKSERWRTEGAGWQERSRSLVVWTKPAKKVCSPGEKSSREMPGSRDLKVGVHGTQAAGSRRKWGCHAANLWYQCSSAYKQRLLKGSLCELACCDCILSGAESTTKGLANDTSIAVLVVMQETRRFWLERHKQ